MSSQVSFQQDSLPDAPTRFAVDEAKPQSWPPRPSRFWSGVLKPLANRYARKTWKVMEVKVDGLAEAYAKFSPNDGVMLAPNHSFEGDAHVLLRAADSIRRRFYFMADWRAFRGLWGIKGWILQRMGVFSVDRDGSDRQALKHAQELLATGQSLVVFPEGEIHHLNARLMPLLDGVAFMAHGAQQQLVKAKSDATVWIVPAAIRYRFCEDIRPELEQAMSTLEKRMFWTRPPQGASLRQRILHFADILLTIKEKEKLGRSSDADGDLPTRIRLLMEALLTRHEQTYLNNKTPAKTVTLRVKALRRCLTDLCTNDESDEAAKTAAKSALEDVQLALQLYSYPGNYIEDDDSVEAMAETLEKFFEDIFSVALCIGHRRAHIVFGEPISLREASGVGRTRAVIEKVTDDLEGRMIELLAKTGEGEW